MTRQTKNTTEVSVNSLAHRIAVLEARVAALEASRVQPVWPYPPIYPTYPTWSRITTKDNTNEDTKCL